MALKKEYVRDFNHRLVGTVTSGFDDGNGSVVRDGDGHITGRTSDRFHETRDNSGRIVSSNTSDPGLLIPRK